jgi:septum formation protein
VPHSNQIVLASASPRRVELLASAGVIVTVRPGNVDETCYPDESPTDHALRLATAKAGSVAELGDGRFFIGADTIVVCGDEIMGKPRDAADAERMLQKLSGVGHDVITGFAVMDRRANRTIANTVSTRVYFKTLRSSEISSYIASGCPFDKAGAYAIQGAAAHMIRTIEGSYTNVVGLPLCEVVEALWTLGALGEN